MNRLSKLSQKFLVRKVGHFPVGGWGEPTRFLILSPLTHAFLKHKKKRRERWLAKQHQNDAQNQNDGPFPATSSMLDTNWRGHLHLRQKSHRFYINCFYSNVRSLLNKKDNLQLVLAEKRFDILLFSETWLNDKVSDSSLTLNLGFNLIRLDRRHKRGGGLAVFLLDSLSFVKVYSLSTNGIEILAFDLFKSDY